MCLLCIELQKGIMKATDVARNFGELADTDPKHAEEVAEKYADQIATAILDVDDQENVNEDPWYFFYNTYD